MTGAWGHGPVLYNTLSWSDVARWTRDGHCAVRFDCAPRMSDSVTPIGPTRCPAARQPNRRVPPRTTACARQASGAIPERPRAHRADSTSRAPRNARQSGGEAQPGGCAIRVRRPLPSSGNQRPIAGRNNWFRSGAEAGSRAGSGGKRDQEGRDHSQPHSAAPRPPPTTRPRRRSAPGLGLNCRGDPRPASPRPD